jgi:NAD-dependent deacetylase
MGPTGTVEELTRALEAANRPLVITGAGISVASGIAPFRGTDEAVWSKTVLEMGTRRMFQRDPARQWAWYLERFEACRGAQPNAAHRALVELGRLKREQGRELNLVTQNIDGLHVAAGSQDVVEVHGAARKLRCARGGCVNGAYRGSLPWDEALFAAFRADPRLETLPRCAVCGKLLRPHVLWFDEVYVEHADYQFEDAERWFETADLFVFVGTSFSVMITEHALDGARMRGAPVWSIDPISEPPEDSTATWLKAASEEALPAVVAAWRG